MKLEELVESSKQVHIFVDLDGTLCDFDKKVKELTGKLPSELPKKELWKAVYSIPDFFESLEWLPDGKQLWNAVKQYHPTILTGLPSSKNGKAQKEKWCAQHLGPNVPVIVCPSRDKHMYAKPGYIIIDDRNDIIQSWNSAGGKGILRRDTTSVIIQLHKIIDGAA